MVNDFSIPAVKLIYVFRINDAAHKGAVKIGEASYNGDLPLNELAHDCKELRQAARERIRQYTQTAGIHFELIWATPAFYFTPRGVKNFNDKEVHSVLTRSGIARKGKFRIR